MEDIVDAIEALKGFGLTGQEATMYVTLLEGGPLTGYEAAKRAGISRSNAYAALAGLTDKGGAMRSGEGTVRFTPTPRRVFLGQLRAQCEAALELLERELPERVDAEEPYLTVSGAANVLARIRAMLEAARSHVYVSAHAREAARMADALAACAARGVKTVLLCDSAPRGAAEAGVIVHNISKEPGHVNIIADTAAVLTGNLAPEATAQCLYSSNTHLVRLMREAFLNELQCIGRRGDDQS